MASSIRESALKSSSTLDAPLVETRRPARRKGRIAAMRPLLKLKIVIGGAIPARNPDLGRHARRRADLHQHILVARLVSRFVHLLHGARHQPSRRWIARPARSSAQAFRVRHWLTRANEIKLTNAYWPSVVVIRRGPGGYQEMLRQMAYWKPGAIRGQMPRHHSQRAREGRMDRMPVVRRDRTCR